MIKIRNFNFRESSSERKGNVAYGNFRKEMVRKIKLEKFKEKFNFKKGK